MELWRLLRIRTTKLQKIQIVIKLRIERVCHFAEFEFGYRSTQAEICKDSDWYKTPLSRVNRRLYRGFNPRLEFS